MEEGVIKHDSEGHAEWWERMKQFIHDDRQERLRVYRAEIDCGMLVKTFKALPISNLLHHLADIMYSVASREEKASFLIEASDEMRSCFAPLYASLPTDQLYELHMDIVQCIQEKNHAQVLKNASCERCKNE